jgi:hypothetical protein
MNSFVRTLIPSLLLVAGTAMAAEPVVVHIPQGAAPPAPTLTRAEVMADLYMWRLAGMQEFTRSDLLDQTGRYQAAMARYRALRESSEFSELVQKLQRQPYAVVVGR